MIISTWNVRGINILSKKRGIAEFISKYKPTVFGLLETKEKQINLSKVTKRIWQQAKFVINNSLESEGRIIPFWDPNKCDISVISASPQALHCTCKCLALDKVFILSVIYNYNTASERIPLWI